MLVVLALCWPMATAFAAAASAPAQHACCMRAAHGCHSRDSSGDSFQAVCRACGWCHALPNARGHVVAGKVTFSFSVYHAPLAAHSESQPSPAPSRLYASRAPPSNASAPEAI
jgi:hypothetical protein